MTTYEATKEIKNLLQYHLTGINAALDDELYDIVDICEEIGVDVNSGLTAFDAYDDEYRCIVGLRYIGGELKIFENVDTEQQKETNYMSVYSPATWWLMTVIDKKMTPEDVKEFRRNHHW